ncbi:MAG: helix-turn-helix domain-containing protein [Candidatus Korobacteraceae bacterium]
MKQDGTDVSDFSWVEIGRRIRDWRLARGWSQQQLADAAGVSQSGVVHLERGDTNPQLGTLREVAAALGRSVRELVLGAVPETQDKCALLHERVRRIVNSDDADAITVMEWGIRSAEILLDRRSVHPEAPRTGRRRNDLRADGRKK